MSGRGTDNKLKVTSTLGRVTVLPQWEAAVMMMMRRMIIMMTTRTSEPVVGRSKADPACLETVAEGCPPEMAGIVTVRLSVEVLWKEGRDRGRRGS